jgi:hypothetical protein
VGVANARTEPIIRATRTRLAAPHACLSFVTNVGRRLRSGIIQKVNEDELDPRQFLHTFVNGMSTQRILLVVAGLSFVALLLAATAPHAGGPTAPSSTAPSSSNVTARVTGEPITDPAVPGTPPEPQPLAPLPPPVAEAVADAPAAAGSAAAGSAAAVVGSASQVAVTAGAIAKPAALPPDVIDDGPSITGSVFDHQDYINRHPVDSDRSITGSKFDREDAVDEHPVP